MAWDMKEEAQGEIIKCYREALEKTVAATETFLQDILAICERTNYKVLVDRGNMCIELYEERVQTQVREYFAEWADSDASLNAFAVRNEVGEEAEATATNMQAQLENEIASMFPQFTEIAAPTGTPSQKDADFEELKEVTDKYIATLEGIRDESLKEVSSASEQNTAFSCIEAVIASSVSLPISTFQSVSAEWGNLHSEVLDRERIGRDSGKQAADDMRNRAQADGEDVFADMQADFQL